MEMETSYYILIALVVLGIVIMIFPGNLIAATRENFTDTKPKISVINVTVEPGDRSIRVTNNVYIYTIALAANLRLSPKQEEGLTVVPVISFKGVDYKDNEFVIPKGEERYDYGKTAEIQSRVPPVEERPVPITLDSLTEGQEVWFRTDFESSIYTLSLLRTYSTGIVGSDKIGLSIIPKCKAVLSLECRSKQMAVTLVQCDSLKDPANKDECTNEFKDFCGGTVKVSMWGEIDCSNGKASDIGLEGTQIDVPSEADRTWAVGDRVKLSFYRKSDCIDKAYTLDEMNKCVQDDKSGTQRPDFLGYKEVIFSMLK